MRLSNSQLCMLPLEHQEEGRIHPPLLHHLLLVAEPPTRPPYLPLLLLLLFLLLFLLFRPLLLLLLPPRRTLPLQHPLHPPRRRMHHHLPHHLHLGITAMSRTRVHAHPKRRRVSSSKRRAAGHFKHCRTSLGGFSMTPPGRG